MKKILISIFAALLCISCAVHNGSVNSSVLPQNTRYTDIAYGIADVSKFLWFGGIQKDALVLQAKQNMIRNRPLAANESYANITVDFQRVRLVIINKTKVTVSADVVEYTSEPGLEMFTDNFESKLKSLGYENDLFAAGDTIFFNYRKSGVILSVGDKAVWILKNSNKKNFRTKRISVNKIYTKKGSYLGLAPGEEHRVSVREQGTLKKENGTIIAIGLKDMLVRLKSGKIVVAIY